MKIGYKYYLNKIHSIQDRSNFIYQNHVIKSLPLSNKIKDEFHFLLKSKPLRIHRKDMSNQIMGKVKNFACLNNLEKFITLMSNLQ